MIVVDDSPEVDHIAGNRLMVAGPLSRHREEHGLPPDPDVRFQTEMRALPGPEEIIDLLEALAGDSHGATPGPPPRHWRVPAPTYR